MKSKLLGSVNFQGGVLPGAYLTSDWQIVLIVMSRDIRTAVGLQFDIIQHQLENIWHHEFTGDTHHNWAGVPIKMNEASLLSAERKFIYLVGGTERLLVNAESGQIIAQETASASPTQPASLVGNELIVPEGRILSAYDSIDLSLKWQKPTPNSSWLSAPATAKFIPIRLATEAIGIYCSLDSDEEDTVALWNFQEDKLWLLPGIIYPDIASVICNDFIVIGSGLGTLDHLIALDLKNGDMKWSIEFPSQISASTGQTPSSRYLIMSNGNSIFLASAKPSLEALLIIDGSCLWRVELSSMPLVLAKENDTVWVGTYAGDIVAVETERGVIRNWAKISGKPISILPLINSSTSTAAIVIDYFGNIYHIEQLD